MAILRSVWEKIVGKRVESEKTLAPVTAINLAQSAAPTAILNSIKSAAHIIQETIPHKYQTLWQLLNQRQIIEIKIENSSLSYQTMVLAIDIQRGLLWLDDIFPNQHMLEIGSQITLRHHRNGEQLIFSSPILAWGSSYGAAGLAIALPDQACYIPRRQNRRANMSDEPSLSLKIRPIGQDISYGSVLDISSSGLRASIPGNLLGQLRHGALLPLCEMNLSNELTIRCSARVRSFRLLRTPHRHTQISLEFIDLLEERSQQLQQFINNLIYLQQTDDMLELRSA